MKNTFIVLLAGISFALVGNARAEITTECTLKGNGDYQCNFHNKGKKKESTCVLMILGKNPGVLGQTMFVGSVMGRLSYQMLAKLGDEAALTAREIKDNKEFTDFLSEQKKLAASSGKNLDAYIKANMQSLSDQILSGEQKGLSSEICSGIVEANDLRERHGSVRFSGGAADNLTPIEACKTDDESTMPWQEICSFTTVKPIELHNYVKNKIKSAPNPAKKVQVDYRPDMVVIPAGFFSMGAIKVDEDERANVKPAHRVTFAKPFAMSKTEVTQGQWQAIMGNNPSGFPNCGDNCPVENVSWDDAKEFIQKLNAKTGKQYRLPSEAEWEYACRAGGQSEFCGSDNIDSIAWYGANYTGGNSAMTTNPVASKQANAWGLYDMTGNVLEWTEDSYHEDYKDAPTDGTTWQGDGVKHVSRGGSWFMFACDAAFRLPIVPNKRSDMVGFRVAETLP